MTFIRVLLACLVLTAPAARAADDPTPLDQRLEAMVQKLDERRAELHIPGLAIAVVKDGEVVLARGLGQRDLERSLPVEPTTTFAIGSSTKSFTSALVGIGIDEGRIGLDDHVRDHVPDFHLADEAANAGVTVRDLLCHRTGLTRMPLLWAGGEGTIDDMLAAVHEAKLYAPFRSAWLYNNVTYAMAGYAVANAYGTTWDALVETRILDPLGMTGATTSLAGLAPENGGSLGYAWNDETESYDHLPARDLHLVAPAGAINASVIDMSKWVRALLAKGGYTDAEGHEQRLISTESLELCWTPQIEMGDGRSYGLGWMVAEHRGRRLVEHGGNIDGYASTLALMPEDGLGFTMLMNVTGSALQTEAVTLVFDALLGPETGESPAPAADGGDLTRLAGKYAFELLGGDLVVRVEGDHLVADVPGQGTTELAAPDEDGWRAFMVNPQARVRFEPAEGPVTSAKFRQGALNQTLPKRAEDGSLLIPPPPFPPEELQRRCGEYRFESLGVTCTVAIKDGQLMMDVPGQTNYALEWDADKELWVFRDFPGIELTFELPEGGGGASAIHFAQSGQRFELPRVGEPELAELPKVEDVLATRAERLGAAKLTPDAVVRFTGTVDVVHQGVKGTLVSLTRGPSTYSTMIDLAPFGSVRSLVTDTFSWSDSPMSGPTTERDNRAFAAAKLGNPLLFVDDLRQYAALIEVTGTEALAQGGTGVVLTLKPEHGPEQRLVIDPETGRIAVFRATAEGPAGMRIPIVTRLSDWREFDGLWYPCRQEVENPASGLSVITIESVEVGVEPPAGAFEVPAEQPAEPEG